MLELDYELTESDVLNMQLYQISQNQEFNKQRKREKIRLIGLSFLFGIILFFDEGFRFFSYFFLGSAVLFFLIYPWWSEWFYKRTLRKEVISKYKDTFPYRLNLVLNDDTLETKTIKGHRAFNISDIKSIAENKNYFFIGTVDQLSIIIPKAQINDLSNIYKQIEYYTSHHNIQFISDLNWRWEKVI